MPWMLAKFLSKCAECGDEIEMNGQLYFNGKAYCTACGPDEEAADKAYVPGRQRKLRF